MELIQTKDINSVINKYSPEVKKKLLELRSLIIEVAESDPDISQLEETLKWNEPSYLTKYGSTIRMDWKSKTPDQVQLYFKCTSKLVLSFKEVFGDRLKYENNRAIILKLDEKLPIPILQKCIHAGLSYHKVKHLNKLGIF